MTTFAKTKTAIRPFLLSVAGLTLLASAAAAAPLSVSQSAPSASTMLLQVQDCFIDDGYGRRSPCDSFYRERSLTNQPAPAGCTIDDGYGRKSSCEAYFKERQEAEKKQQEKK